jgi:hypothetical protein
MMRPRKTAQRKPKNILLLALNNLWPGEELICTQRTFSAISSRVNSYFKSTPTRRLAIVPWDGLRKIRRVA